jgi:hypothetical protein
MAIQFDGTQILFDGGSVAMDGACCCGGGTTCCDTVTAVSATVSGLPCRNGTYALTVSDGACARYAFESQINHCFSPPPVCLSSGGSDWYRAELIVYVDVGNASSVTGYVKLELWGYPSGPCNPRTGISNNRWDFEKSGCAPGAMTLTGTSLTGTDLSLSAPSLSWSDV